jgi:uncharacterized protein (DUF1501 family)
MNPTPQHPTFTRRQAIQAGSIGLLGLGMNHVAALRAAADAPRVRAKSCIYIFLSGGLSQIDSFDPKPDAPPEIRGEFKAIATRSPGVRICEHLPMLAQRSHLWSVVRSMTHRTNGHREGHLMMLAGHSEVSPGFNGNMPKATDWPSIAAVAGELTRPRNNLPPAAILPDRLVHYSGQVIPGPYAGMMGRHRDPWVIEVSPFNALSYGAYPQYAFDHQRRTESKPNTKFEAPNLSLPEGLTNDRLGRRLDFVHYIDEQRRDLEHTAATGVFDHYRQGAVSLLTDGRVRKAFDISRAEPKVRERYGDNAFGWSLLMAKQLVQAGVNMVQVNLGNNETWDTHGFMFPHLKDKLFPPTDRAISALLDDLQENGLLDDTLIVMAGEFGRTPRITTLPKFYREPGRDHWGAVQTVFFAGGGTKGGKVVGSSDKNGGYPHTDPQTPESMAATIYHSLGIPQTAAWHDSTNRPHFVYHGGPITGLL